MTLPPLGGVNFDVYQVFTDSAHTQKVDLTTNDGWTAAAAVNGYTPTAADFAAGSFVVGGTTYYLGGAGTVTTDASGNATFTKPNGVGLYLVNENLASSGTISSPTNPNVPKTVSYTHLDVYKRQRHDAELGCVAGGLLLQHLPDGEVGRDRIEARADHPEWEHALSLIHI